MDQEIDHLACRYCGKEAKSKSGLTNHEKTCKKAPKGSGDVNVSDRDQRPEEEDDDQDFDQDHGQRHDRSKSPKTGQWQIGAFFMMPDHIPMLLDIDFCSALSTHILEHGSSNSAIMAFAHQLNKVAGD
jgi:hypothetical protein